MQQVVKLNANAQRHMRELLKLHAPRTGSDKRLERYQKAIIVEDALHEALRKARSKA